MGLFGSGGYEFVSRTTRLLLRVARGGVLATGFRRSLRTTRCGSAVGVHAGSRIIRRAMEAVCCSGDSANGHREDLRESKPLGASSQAASDNSLDPKTRWKNSSGLRSIASENLHDHFVDVSGAKVKGNVVNADAQLVNTRGPHSVMINVPSNRWRELRGGGIPRRCEWIA
jgi:hypothetical protein